MQISRKVLGNDSKRTAFLLNNLAVLKSYQGDLDGAKALYREVVAIVRKWPGPENQVELATDVQNLGATLKAKGEYAEAEPSLREAVDLRRRLLGEKHPYVPIAQIHLADLFYRREEYDKAEKEVRAALEIQRAALPVGHIDLARAYVVLGAILTRTGEPVRGEPYLRRALAIRRKGLAEGHILISLSEGALGECLTAQKRYTQAEPLLMESYATLKSTQGERDPRTVEALRRLVTLYDAWKKPEKSARYRALLPQTSQ